jgi:hypothetical protein
MKFSPVRGFLSGVAGFAGALLGGGLVTAAVAGLSFHPGGEFGSAWESATVQFVGWTTLMLVFSGAGFAGVTALLIPLGRVLPRPALVGVVAGVGVVVLAGVGVVGLLQRMAEVPFPIATAVPGVAFGAVALAASPAVRRSDTGA